MIGKIHIHEAWILERSRESKKNRLLAHNPMIIKAIKIPLSIRCFISFVVNFIGSMDTGSD
jgi:hypothetical protein